MTLPWSNFQETPQWAKVHWIPFVSSGINVRDIVLNVAAFLPFGFLVASERCAVRPTSSFWVIGAAALFSAAGELSQLFNHSRFPSTTDIVSNTAGAYGGFILHSLGALIRRRARSAGVDE